MKTYRYVDTGKTIQITYKNNCFEIIRLSVNDPFDSNNLRMDLDVIEFFLYCDFRYSDRFLEHET